MTRRSGGFRGAKPTWTTTSTSGVFGMEDVVDLKAAGQWPRGPVAPASLAGTAGDGQVELTWAAPATTHGTITDYVVEYTPAAGSPTVVSTGSTAASYTLTGLTNDTEYTFRVAAVNHTRGDWSDSVAVTPAAVQSGVIMAGSNNSQANGLWVFGGIEAFGGGGGASWYSRTVDGQTWYIYRYGADYWAITNVLGANPSSVTYQYIRGHSMSTAPPNGWEAYSWGGSITLTPTP